MKTRFLKFALLAVFCVGATATNAQTKLSDEAVKVIKELKQVDTKGLSADEAQTVMKVLNQIKRENTPSAQFSAPMFYQRGEDCTTKCPREELKVVATTVSVAEKPLFILDGKEISIEEFNRLNPNCVEDLKIIKGEEAVNKYGEKAANGVLVITAKKDNAEKVQVTGFTVIKGKGDVTTEPIANVDLAVKAVNQGNVLVILDGIEISEEKFKSLDPNSVEKLELRKGETMKRLYGEKAANGVLFITSKKANQEKVQVTGFTVIKGKGDVTTEPIANLDLAVKAVNLNAVNQGNLLLILDGIEISEEKLKSLDPNSIEKLELRKGEIMKRLYGEKAADGVLMITAKKDCKQQKIDNEDVEIIYHGKVISKEEAEKMGITVNVIVGEMKDNQVKIVDAKRQRIAEMRQRRANAQNVHVVTKSDLKPVDSATKVKAISIFEPTFHVRGSMARIENVNSDELPVISKFKQNGNQVSFRIEIPKSENTKKQKFDIQYTLPTEM
ncbi:MAG: hypothetical protein J6R62_02150 [Rikenellaceae bacterium]|nr:hypothetical protein [Rikenellaceae bacterium]